MRACPLKSVRFSGVIVAFKQAFVLPKLISVYFIRVTGPLARGADCGRIAATRKAGAVA
jgi:hypothetical protein